MSDTEVRELSKSDKMRKSPFHGFRTPMLATLTKHFFDDPQWIYERKFDGMRCLVYNVGGETTLYSRNGRVQNHSFPDIAGCIPALTTSDFVADGEIVTFEGKQTSFRKLQKRLQVRTEQKARNTGIKVYLYLFDLISLDGRSLSDLPLTDRKQLLKERFHWEDPVRYTPHRRKNGLKYHTEACRKGWEGIIAKDGESAYRHERSMKWLKFKCVNSQELVIGGYTLPRRSRKGFGALLVGYYEGKKLLYAGKVGTGFTDDFLTEWRAKFDKISRNTSPFSDFSDAHNGGYQWIEPKFVGQFEFTEWTRAGKLRHPSFTGIRNDKKPREVIKEI